MLTYKKYLFIYSLVFYLIIVFIFSNFRIWEINIIAKTIIVVIYIILFIYLGSLLEGYQEQMMEKQNENNQKLKKYAGELKEEIELYNEAIGLERKINEIRNKKK